MKAAASSLTEFEPRSRFRAVIDDGAVKDPASVRRVIVLSGKIYYDLVKERATLGLQDSDKLAFIRIEELSPFPYKLLAEVLQRYPNAQEWCFVQEEPRNQGPWPHVSVRLHEVRRKSGDHSKTIRYIGRKEDAVPAVGVGKVFKEQQASILREVFAGL